MASESDKAKENPTASKETPTVSKENPTLTKENPTLTKENPTLTKENSTLTKENPTLTKENPTPTTPTVAANTFDNYMERLDRSATKRSDLTHEDLLKIVDMTKANPADSQKFNDHRLSVLFYLIEKLVDKYDANQLSRLMLDAADLKIDPEAYYKNFFSVWEKQNYAKMSAEKTVLTQSLRVYAEYGHDLPIEFVEKWSQLASEKIDEFSIDESTQLMEIFAAKKVRPNDVFLQKWTNKTSRNTNVMNADVLASVVYVSGKLNVEEMKENLTNLNESKFFSMNGQQLAKTLYGLTEGKIALKNEDNFLSQCSSIFKKSMKSLTVRDLARVLCVISKNERLKSDQELYAVWESATEAALESPVIAADLSTILTGLRRLKASGLMEREISKKLLNSWINGALGAMQKFWPEMLPSMVGDLCKLGNRPNEDFVKHWLMTLKHSLGKLYGRDFVTVITSLADNSYFLNDYDSHFVEAWCDAVQDKSSFWSEAMKLNLRSAFQTMNIAIDEKLEKILA